MTNIYLLAAYTVAATLVIASILSVARCMQNNSTGLKITLRDLRCILPFVLAMAAGEALARWLV